MSDRPFLVSSGANPSHGFSAFDGDHTYVSEGRRIGDNVRNIRRFALEVNSKNTKKSKLDPKTAHMRIMEAQALAKETKNLLDNFGEVMGVSDAEKVQKRLMHHSLSRQFEMVLIFLGDCIAEYESNQLQAAQKQKMGGEQQLIDSTRDDETSTLPSEGPSTTSNEFQFSMMKESSKLESAILDEKTKDMMQAHEDLQSIRSLCHDLLGQIEYQGNDLNAIESQIESTVDLTDASVGHLRNAWVNHLQQYKLWFLVGAFLVLVVFILFLSLR